MLPDKWRFNTSQNWEVLGDKFDSISLDIILDNTLQALNFYLFFLDYLEERAPRVVEIIDNLDLTIELVNNGQQITDSENEKMKKKNKCAAKRKAQLDNLFALVRAPAASFAALLLSYSALISCPKFFTPLLSRFGCSTYLLPLLACPEILITSFSRLVPTLVPVFSAILLLFFVLGSILLHLTSKAFKAFKQALLYEFLHCRSTSPAKSLYQFPLLALLPDKTDCKRNFDTTFLKSRLRAGNHTQKEIDLSFVKSGCPALVKLNWIWQLKLVNYKLVCIMKAISFAAAIF